MSDTNPGSPLELVPAETQPRTRVLSNGAVYNLETGRIVQGPTNPPINRENAATMQKRRVEVARAKIAKSIADKSQQKNALVRGPGDAVAYAAGELWHDIVLNKQASDRERTQAWQVLTKAAGYLPNERDSGAETGNGGAIPAESALTSAIYGALMRIRDELSGNDCT